MWAPTVLAEILPVFHPEDRHGARKLVATAGLDVKQADSGGIEGRGRLSKRGGRYLRTAVMQASEIAVFKSHDPLLEKSSLTPFRYRVSDTEVAALFDAVTE